MKLIVYAMIAKFLLTLKSTLKEQIYPEKNTEKLLEKIPQLGLLRLQHISKIYNVVQNPWYQDCCIYQASDDVPFNATETFPKD